MPYRITVSDVQRDVGIQKISGVRPDSPEFFAYLNEVEKSLMIRGGWFDLEQRVNFCLSGRRIVWPEFVGTVLAIRFCHGNVAVSRNGWYSFAPNQSIQRGNRGFGNGAGFGMGFGNGFGREDGYGPDVIVEDDNSRPCYSDLSCGSGSLIRYTIEKSNDVGKTITIFGKKFGGQPLQEQVGGAWVNGVTLTAKNPYAQGFDLVTDIQSIVREPTEGPGYLWEFSPETGLLRDIAVFRPGETHPRYRCSRILNVPHRTNDANGCCWTRIEAKIKLQFVELTAERDFIPVDNLRAVKLGFQAVKLEEKNQDQEAAAKWQLAIHELNLESFDKSPDDQIVFQNNTFGDVGRLHRRLY
jgi:hypothetical protein